jgi:tRNA (cytidine32/uridine32-2'-O)-methyltransferase
VDPSLVEIVLVRPSRAANVAAACRAMKNMGLRALWIVGPPENLDAPEARSLAYGAWDVLDGARRGVSLLEAVAASVAVVGTTGREVPGALSPRRLAAEAEARAGGGRLSLVFGPESSGLTRAEMDLCHALVHVPTDPAQPSLNLAQAVLLLAYEMRLAALDGPARSSEDPEGRASAGDVEQAVRELRGALLDVGYLDPASPDHVLTELRRLIARGRPSPREVVLLRGLARQVRWAGRVARGGAGPDNPQGGRDDDG